MDPSTQSDGLRPWRWRALVALLGACGFGLAACGGSGSHTGTGARAVKAAVTTTAAQTAPDPSTIRAAKKATAGDSRTTKAADSGSTSSTSRDPSTTSTTSSEESDTTSSSSSAAATANDPKRILSCLRGAGLAPVSAASSALWTGYEPGTGTFVYVYKHHTKTEATDQARSLSPEEVATVGVYLVNQPITHYPSSPVPVVAACLSGKPIKKVTKKHKGSFTF